MPKDSVITMERKILRVKKVGSLPRCPGYRRAEEQKSKAAKQTKYIPRTTLKIHSSCLLSNLQAILDGLLKSHHVFLIR